MNPARAERLALCDLFDDLGPEGPTVLDGWGTAELAAHLLTRETRPDALPGLVVPAAHHWTERVERGVQASVPYGVAVRRLRAGPPAFAPTRLPGGWRGDLHEWFVHHEDVRRATGLGPRPDGPEQRRLDEAVWGILPLWGALLARRLPVATTLVTDDGRRRRVVRGPGALELHGRASELLLALFDRRLIADVRAVGDPDAVHAWEVATVGL